MNSAESLALFLPCSLFLPHILNCIADANVACAEDAGVGACPAGFEGGGNAGEAVFFEGGLDFGAGHGIVGDFQNDFLADLEACAGLHIAPDGSVYLAENIVSNIWHPAGISFREWLKNE